MGTISKENGQHTSPKYGYARAVSGELHPTSLVVTPEALGFTDSVDFLTHAANIERSQPAMLLRDAARGGARIWVTNLSPDVQDALSLIDIQARTFDPESLNGDSLRRLNTPSDFETFGRDNVYIVDDTGIIEGSKDNPIVAPELKGTLVCSPFNTRRSSIPESSLWRNIVRTKASSDGTNFAIHIGDTILGRPSFVDQKGPKAMTIIRDALKAAKKLPPANHDQHGNSNGSIDSKAEVKVRIPLPVKREDDGHVLTSVAGEAAFLKAQREYDLQNTTPSSNKDIQERILHALLRFHEESVPMSSGDRTNILRGIAPYLGRGEPFPISLAFAIGMKVLNPLKHNDPDNLPHFGWMHFGHKIALMSEQVKRVYEPGIKVVVFDESTLFSNVDAFNKAMGFSPESVAAHLESTKRLLKSVGAYDDDPQKSLIHILPMNPKDFPNDKVAKVELTDAEAVDNSRVYAIVCSRPDMRDPVVMDPLYTDREARSYPEIIERVGRPYWESSRQVATLIAKHMKHRKLEGLFDKAARDTGLRDGIAIDATVTDKAGRLVLDITPKAMFNHAPLFVSRNNSGRYKVEPVPEYRIMRDHPSAQKILVPASELSPRGTGYLTFLYEERK